jgi:hypothetical protein
VKCHGLFHIIFVLNGHMFLGGEHVVFGLAILLGGSMGFNLTFCMV